MTNWQEDCRTLWPLWGVRWTDHEQIHSRINNNWYKTFWPHRPLSTACKMVCTQLAMAHWPKRSTSVVIDSATYLLMISLPDIENVAINVYDISVSCVSCVSSFLTSFVVQGRCSGVNYCMQPTRLEWVDLEQRLLHCHATYVSHIKLYPGVAQDNARQCVTNCNGMKKTIWPGAAYTVLVVIYMTSVRPVMFAS